MERGKSFVGVDEEWVEVDLVRMRLSVQRRTWE